MTWMIEWKEWDEKTKDYILNSDSYDKWEDVVRIFSECANDLLCGGATVYSFMCNKPYPTDDPIVLDYRP